jgi:hypothetical protein
VDMSLREESSEPTSVGMTLAESRLYPQDQEEREPLIYFSFGILHSCDLERNNVTASRSKCLDRTIVSQK